MRIPVIVVGAGPAGLVAALELARRGVPLRIIDAAAGPARASRAKGLQPRTLEMFERLGLLEEVLAGGGRFPRWRSYRDGRTAWEKSIYELLGIAEPAATAATPYPETWMVPQWRTEGILRRALADRGVEVEYGLRLTGLAAGGAPVVATLRRGGKTETVEATYVIGADGAASHTRGFLGVAFEGVTRDDERFVTADVRTGDLDRAYWHNWARADDPAARVSVCPLPATDVFQLVAPLHPDDAPPLTLAGVQALFDARAEGVTVRLDDAPWITLHRTNERLASRLRVGNVFLVGDAAHTVPAAGGQGLNVAVQDAHNLGWKLAAVLRGAPADLLDSYEPERRPIAAHLLAGLDVADENGDKPDVFQLRTTYRGGSLCEELRRAPGRVRAGDRAPDGPVQPSTGGATRLFEVLRDAELTCVAFGAETAAACRDALRHGHRTSVGVLDVDRDSPATAAILADIYDIGADARCVVLVRPDGYIGLAADDDLTARVGAYLARVAPPVPASPLRAVS